MARQRILKPDFFTDEQLAGFPPHPVLPLGSIEGLGERQVHDIGGAVRGKHVDVYVSGCKEARAWGRQARLVRVLHRGGRR
jgi:hypothetical protein